jgi:allantoate deiminase
MDMRRDAGVAAAAGIVAITARPAEGVTTVGSVHLEPGVPTAVPGAAEIVVDLRNPTAKGLATNLADVRAALDQIARDRGCHLSGSPVWSIEPIAFDKRIVEAVRAATGSDRTFASGALHDAAEMARHVPAGMVFTSSTAGLSHTKEEDTPEPHLERAIAAYADVARQLIAGEIV